MTVYAEVMLEEKGGKKGKVCEVPEMTFIFGHAKNKKGLFDL